MASGHPVDSSFADDLEPSSVNSRHTVSNPNSYISEPAFGLVSQSASSSSLSNTTYANRAASKASATLARFGKAIYGGSVTTSTSQPLSITSSGVSISGKRIPSSHLPLDKAGANKTDTIKFTARSEIIAMGPSPTENAVSIAGKDCKYYTIVAAADATTLQTNEISLPNIAN